MATCGEPYRPYYALNEAEKHVTCHRWADESGRHKGDHQGIYHVEGKPPTENDFGMTLKGYDSYDRLVTWDEGGSQAQKYHPDEPNTNCMCRNTPNRLKHKPEDHHWAACSNCGITFDSTGQLLCSGCGIWITRAKEYKQPSTNLVRPHGDELAHHPRLYSWSRVTGAFGGRMFKVTWDDGRTAGPRDCLWDGGRIPWWFLDQFPPNGRIEAAGQMRRQGHTDSLGRPLSYNLHPPT